MTSQKMADSLAAVSQVLQRTAQSEVEYEVDHDLEALQQIAYYTSRLNECYRFRLRFENIRFLSTVLRQLAETAKKKGVRAEVPFQLSEQETENAAHLTDQGIFEVLKSLCQCRDNARLCCMKSRAFRYEVACLYILGTLLQYKTQLTDGIVVLRDAVLRFKRDDSVRKEYVQNVEMRLAHLESMYEDVFGAEFDAQNPPRQTGDDPLACALNRILNLEQDLHQTHQHLQAISSLDTECLQRADTIVSSAIVRNSEAANRLKMASDGLNNLVPQLEQLTKAIDELGGAGSKRSTAGK
jgi:hypothetical protein